MPLVILCGLPSSGKTRIAEQLQRDLDARMQRGRELDERDAAAVAATGATATATSPSTSADGATGRHKSTTSGKNRKRRPYSTLLINDASLRLSKAAYDAGVLEKRARGALFAAVERGLSRDCFVLCDAMNYVKGFRYQLHCAAKAVATPHCCLHVAASDDTCRRWWRASRDAASRERSTDGNGEGGEKDLDGQVYPEKVFEELLMRFEEPQPTVRWDRPLFTVLATDAGVRGRPPTREICAHLAPDLVFDDADEVGLEDYVPELDEVIDGAEGDRAGEATLDAAGYPTQMSLAQRMAMANLEPPKDGDGNIPTYGTHGAGSDGASLSGRTDSLDSEDEDEDEDDELADLPPNLRPAKYRSRVSGSGSARNGAGSVASGRSTGTARSTMSTSSMLSQRTTASVAQARAVQMARGTAGDVRPHGATTVSANAHTRADHLQRLDRSLAAVVRAIAAAARQGEDSVRIDLVIQARTDLSAVTWSTEDCEDDSVFELNLPDDNRTSMADLQRLKRQFLSINRNAATLATTQPNGTKHGQVAIDPAKRLFCIFLASQFGES